MQTRKCEQVSVKVKETTAPLTVDRALELAGGDGFAAAILDCTTRKNGKLFPFDNEPHGPWRVTSVELAAMGFWSRFAGDGAGWPGEKDVPGRLVRLRPLLATHGVAFRGTNAGWIFSVASTRN
jgi:hypothetical protein